MAIRREIAASWAAMQRGCLCPGDPPPVPGGPPYVDYRGIGLGSDLRGLSGPVLSGYALGHVVDPRRGPVAEAWLPPQVAQRHTMILEPTGSGKTTGVVVP
jgi:hypothetical protein